ncbi:hypothetical protein, partial [uncultured Bilophila sp.]|uniref:hypothetical protein n=1 Tax=uncultured Bilophila sp. TaxID=529385 RepID=UPI00261196D1
PHRPHPPQRLSTLSNPSSGVLPDPLGIAPMKALSVESARGEKLSENDAMPKYHVSLVTQLIGKGALEAGD